MPNKKSKTIWILAVIAIIVVGVILVKNANLFAVLPAGQYIQFRTTDITYPIGSAIAYSGTCGNALTAYGYATRYGSGSSCYSAAGNCASGMAGCTYCPSAQYLFDVPGGWMTSGGVTSLWSTSNENTCLCQNELDGAGWAVVRYSTTDLDASKVDTRNTETIDSTKEKICGESTQPTCPDNHQCGETIEGARFCIENSIAHTITTYVCTPAACTPQTHTVTEMSCSSIPSAPICLNGECTAICTTQNTPADTNCDNKVSFAELNAYANKWVAGQVTFVALIQAANAWQIG